jgi:hypothetical protein
MSSASKSSGDIADELRAYAKEKEEGMRMRLTEFRHKKDKELKENLTERIREFELRRIFAERTRDGITEPVEILRDLELMIKRVRSQTQRAAGAHRVACTGDDFLIENLRMQLASDLEAKLGDVRFNRECEILAEYKQMTDQIQRIRAAISSDALIESTAPKDTLECIDGLSKLVRDRAANRESERKEMTRRVETEMQSILRKCVNELSVDCSGLLHGLSDSDQSSAQKLLSERRRVQITIAKRIRDLSAGADEARSVVTHEIVSEYREELTKLLIRCLHAQVLPDSSRSVSAGDSTPSIAHAIAHVPTKEKVKFIHTIFERFACGELASCVINRLDRGLEDSVSFRS